MVSLRDGNSPQIPVEIVDKVRLGSDEFNYSSEPMYALAPDDTANAALDVALDNILLLNLLVHVDVAARLPFSEPHCVYETGPRRSARRTTRPQ